MALVFLEKRLRYNWRTLQTSPLSEISGAFGDLGTLLPLMTALAAQGAISLSSTLVFTGLFNIVTGAFFGIPLPVQPMKAIAAAVISEGATKADTTAAGALVSSTVLVLALTGLLRWLSVTVPVPVIKGIQLGAGLSLAISMARMWKGNPDNSSFDSPLYALLAFLWLIYTQPSSGKPVPSSPLLPSPSSSASSTAPEQGGESDRISSDRFGQRLLNGWRRLRHFAALFLPYALTMTIIGLALALAAVIQKHNQNPKVSLPHFAFWHPRLSLPNWKGVEAMSMAVAQLPLTTLNSVIAVSSLADDLFGSRRPWDNGEKEVAGRTENVEGGAESDVESGRPDQTVTRWSRRCFTWSVASFSSVTAFGFSVGAMNLVGCWFGAMPVCHGAGGLAAQYRFGARSGASVMILGLVKVLLGLFAGETLVDLLQFFPKSILGILVLAAGLELAKAGLSLNHGAPDLWIEEEATNGGEFEEGARHGGAAASARPSYTEPTGAAMPQLRPRQKRQRVLSDEERAERWTVMLMTTACILTFKNDAIGFVAGLLCHFAYRGARKSRSTLSSETGNGSSRYTQADERTALLT